MLSLTYVSSATKLLDENALVTLLDEIRPRNRELGVTGMLLYRGGNIIQTLEGHEDAVERTFDRIRADPRHQGILVLLRDAIERRSFPDWSMGFPRSQAHTASLAGFTPFLEGGRDRPGAPSGRRMLESFRAAVR